MARVADALFAWLGWCPYARAADAGPVPALPQVVLQPVRPGGGTGGAGRAGRGTGIALGSIRILVRHPRLFWFSLLTGLVLIGSLAANLYLLMASGTDPFPAGTGIALASPALQIAKGSPAWFALAAATSFTSSILSSFFLAGLIACTSGLLAGKAAGVRDGLARAGEHLRPLAGWAAVGAILGTANSLVTNTGTAGIPVTLFVSGVMLLFYILTMFVVPAVVLDNRSLLPAIRQSVAVFRKTWGEIAVCCGILFLIVFIVYLLALVPIIFAGFSSGSMATAGFSVILTMAVMVVLIFIGTTVVGIATLGLYLQGTTGRLLPEFGGTPGVAVPA